MNIQLILVIICVAIAAFFICRRFLRAVKSKACPGCSKTNCCDPTACPEQKQLEELRPRPDGKTDSRFSKNVKDS